MISGLKGACETGTMGCIERKTAIRELQYVIVTTIVAMGF